MRNADLAGLYRGGCITLLRDIPAHAIYFTSYELCHELFEPGSRATGIHSPAALFMSGDRSRLVISHERQQHHLMCASASLAYPSDKPFLILKRWVAEMSSCQLLPSVDSQASDQLSIG